MRIGLQINRFTWPGEPQSIRDTLKNIATTADVAGFYSIWIMDHFFQISFIGSKEEPMLEAYTTLGFLAGITKKVKLGTMVTGVIYRHPSLLIKAVTALDVLSKGRAYLGIGAAWNEEEARALGFRFPPLKERFEQLEDTLQLAHQMFADDQKPFQGKQFTLEEPINHPLPLSKPHPPILIGGGGEKKTLRFVAQYGDACNLFAQVGKEELTRKLDILKQHCKDIGRDYNEIEKTVLSNFVSQEINAKQVIDDCKELRELGIDQVIISIPNVREIEPLKVFGEKIIPAVSKL